MCLDCVYPDGNLTQFVVRFADGLTVAYGYDGAGHLTSETRNGTGAYSISYALDGVGNRLSQTSGSGTTTFAYDNDDELLSTSGAFNNTYGYNANGEQTSRTLNGTAYTLAYDYDGQLNSIAQGANATTFAYDAGGRRVSRTAGGTTTTFLYDGGSVLLEQQNGATTATYTYGNALVRKDGEFPLFDGQGSKRTVTNAGQAMTELLNFYPPGRLPGMAWSGWARRAARSRVGGSRRKITLNDWLR